MRKLITKIKSGRIIRLDRYRRSSQCIKNEELLYIDKLLDNKVLNDLFSYVSYNSAMRDIFPSNLFRVELLKAIRYQEISYRRFCTDEYLGKDRKKNRVFIGLTLNSNRVIDPNHLSKLRSFLSFVQQVNLLVYILYHFKKSGFLGDNILHGVCSTELASDCKLPLATLDIRGKKVRIYSDNDCDHGRRRNKRDKSVYVVVYRLRTLTAIDANIGYSFPFISVLAAVNHHDKHFLPLLVSLAQAMGINVELITADEAYHDKDGSLYEDTGVALTTPPLSKVLLPSNTDGETGVVFYDENCHISMVHASVDEQEHEYKCNAGYGECEWSSSCSKCRFIPIDCGIFQYIPYHTDLVRDVHDIRKNCERPFNLLKIQTDLEAFRVRRQRVTMARYTLDSISVLLIKMADMLKKEAINNPKQIPLFQYKEAA